MVGMPGESSRALTLHERLRDDLRAKIDSGIYGPGERIPSENELSQIYGMSRVTVRSALNELVSEGLLVRRKGSGTYVSPHAKGTSAYLTGSFSENCRRKGMVPSTRVLRHVRVIPPSDVVEMLGGADDEVWEVRRVRLADGLPCVLEIDYLPRACDALVGRISDDVSLFELLKQEGIGPVVGFDDRFGARAAGPRLAQVLACSEQTPLLEVLERLSDPAGQVIYVNRQYIVPERYTHEVGTSRSYL